MQFRRFYYFLNIALVFLCFFDYNMNAVFFRGVAQVVERLVRDQEAAGSSPVTPTSNTARVARFQTLAFLLLK